MSYTTQELIDRAYDIRKTEIYSVAKGSMASDYISVPKYNKWINDVKIKETELSEKCPLKKELANTYFFRNNILKTFDKMVGLLESLNDWEKTNKANQFVEEGVILMQKQYDLFLSHANADKLSYVDDLYLELKKLGINVFYDKESLSWGDKWKDKIIKGTAESEFAIIVISKNFFDREWTERELNEFLNRQNTTGQKIILPLLYKITYEDLKERYPEIADIQAIQTDNITNTEICVLFAKELIKRLKKIQ